MKLPWLKSAFTPAGEFISVHLDTTRTDPNAAAELTARWNQFRNRLAADGAPTDILDEIEEAVLSPSPIGGRHGRTIIATPKEIILDRVLPVPPREAVSFGPQPMLLPLVQVVPYAVSQLLIEVDRAGADLHLRAPENPKIDAADADKVDGGHDELHKASAGGGSRHGWRAREFNARVEDSWERNAEAVARKVDALVLEHKPDMVLITGDVRATSLLRDALGQDAAERVQVLSGGTRGVSMERAAFRKELQAATAAFIEHRQKSVAESFLEGQQRAGATVGGGSEVASTLQRGQVEDLVLVVGQEPDNVEELIRAAIETDAGVHALEPESASIPDGVGAFLRWRDGATPSDGLASMSGDKRREGAGSAKSPHELEEEALRA
ncbi:MAG: baeRF2 domain-containing protein [Galactobacter sp.]